MTHWNQEFDFSTEIIQQIYSEQSLAIEQKRAEYNELIATYLHHYGELNDDFLNSNNSPSIEELKKYKQSLALGDPLVLQILEEQRGILEQYRQEYFRALSAGLHQFGQPQTRILREKQTQLGLSDSLVEQIEQKANEEFENNKQEFLSLVLAQLCRIGILEPKELNELQDELKLGDSIVQEITQAGQQEFQENVQQYEIQVRKNLYENNYLNELALRDLRISLGFGETVARGLQVEIQKQFEKDKARLGKAYIAAYRMDIPTADRRLEDLRTELGFSQSVAEKIRKQFLALTDIEQLVAVNLQPNSDVTRDKLKYFEVSLKASPDRISIGQEVEVAITLKPYDRSSDGYLLSISHTESTGENLNILLSLPGFQIQGSNVASLLLDPENEANPQSQVQGQGDNSPRPSFRRWLSNFQSLFSRNQSGAQSQSTPQPSFSVIPQTASFKLIALSPGNLKIKAELYHGSTFETTLEYPIQVVNLETIRAYKTSPKVEPRPVRQPDLIFQVQTAWSENRLSCTFHYSLNSFHPRLTFANEILQQSNSFLAESLERIRSLLQATLEETSNSQLEDCRSRLISLGQHLFQTLLPPDLQTTFRTVMRFSKSFTLLILADQDAWFPWELLHDGQSFLGEQFVIGRWSWELDQIRPYEFPIGSVNLTHYADAGQPEQWATLLEPPGAPQAILLSGGVLADLSAVETMRGLHLLRRGQSVDEVARQDAPVPIENPLRQALEEELQPTKLSLRRNRPLVTLGYLSAGLPELTSLEQCWAPTFIRSGCSGFLGSLWAVEPTVEAAFISNFYHCLWKGHSLGMAFQAGRQAARSLVPNSLDWMAYTLFGDPMARPYRPTEGKGYAVVEPIGQEISDAIVPGASVRFRVSLRRTPPVWYTNRLMDVADDLAFNDLQVYIAASGLQVAPAESIGMQRTPTGDYLGWFTLTVPSTFAGDSALVQVHFEDGVDPVHSLRFSLTMGCQESEQP